MEVIKAVRLGGHLKCLKDTNARISPTKYSTNAYYGISFLRTYDTEKVFFFHEVNSTR